MKRTIPVFLFLTIFVSITFAVPIEINYQGYLTDPGGVPIDGTKNFTFKLYDSLDAVQWDSGAVAVDVESGVYSITLGAAPQPAINPAIFAQDLWLGITVEGDVEMAPKQKLTSVGYSLRARMAEDVEDGVITDMKISGTISAGKLPVGTTAGTVAAGDHTHPDDGDGDAANELNTSVSIAGTVLHVTDAGGDRIVDLAETLSLGDLDDVTDDGINLYIGANSGVNDAGTDNYNLAVGLNALSSNTAGLYNAAIGFSALSANTIGRNNTAVGELVMVDNLNGADNVAVGTGALKNNISGNANVSIGYHAGYGGEAGSGNIFIGNRAGEVEFGSNKLYIANTNDITPLIYGDFSTNDLTINGNLAVTGRISNGIRSIVLGATEMIFSPGDTTYMAFDGSMVYKTSGSTYSWIPLTQVPDGATVSGLSCTVTDLSDTNLIAFSLFICPSGGSACTQRTAWCYSGSSGGCVYDLTWNAGLNTLNASLTPFIVDLDNNSYNISFWYSSPTCGSNCKFHSCKVTYN